MSIHELVIKHSQTSPIEMMTFIIGCILFFIFIFVALLVRKSDQEDRDSKWHELVQKLELQNSDKGLNFYAENESDQKNTVSTNQNVFAIGLAAPKKNFDGLNLHIRDLLDIEESLLTLRELYQRRLIDSSIYVEKSMKHSARLQG